MPFFFNRPRYYPLRGALLIAYALVLPIALPAQEASNQGDETLFPSASQPTAVTNAPLRSPRAMSWFEAAEELFQTISAVRALTNDAPTAPATGTQSPSIFDKARSAQDTYLQVRALESNRIVFAAMRAAQDPNVVGGLQGMRERGGAGQLLLYQLFAIILLAFLKNWRLSKLEKGQFGRRVYIGCSSVVLFFVTTSFLVPYAFYGSPYGDFIWGLYSVLRDG